MTNLSLITTPDLTQDTMGKVAQCRTNIISIYRELTADDRFETEPGASFPVNVMNQTLFELLQTMIGKDKEHATIAQSFLNCDRLMLDKLADMSFPQFSRICCHHFVGFKSNIATEDIMSALDGDIRPNGIDVCQAEKFRFISMYWMEIWRNVRSNYLNTRFCTQLDVDVLNKLSVTSADKMIAFLFDARHSFVPMFDAEQILSFEKSIPAGGGRESINRLSSKGNPESRH